MRNIFTSRGLITRALLSGVLAGFSGGAYAQQPAAPIVRRPPPAQSPNRANANVRAGIHLPQWMNQHSGLTLQQQQQALDREPGFHQLSPQTQQQMHQELARLHAMAPVQRQRLLNHTEALERLTLPQRSQVRGAMEQLGSLPPRERSMVAQSFRDLRMLPPNQRMAVLMSGRYSWLNPAQLTVLTNLIQIAPMLPPQ